ncbi:MAG TPA: 7TM-DISM domain-containing protein, partial [Pseudoxanthomonas sp.]
MALFAMAAFGAHAQPPLELTAASRQQSLALHTDYYHDATGTDDAAKAMRHIADGRFQPLPGGNSSFGFQDGAYWFHAEVVNLDHPEEKWLLTQEYALSDRIDVYAKYADGRVLHYTGGDHLPFEQRNIRYRHPNFWLTLPQGQPVTLLLRVQSESSMQVPLHLYTPSAFIEQSRDAQFAIGLYYGILLALFIYNLVLWLALRDAGYFWYLFHITAFGLVLFTLNGLGFEYLWPNSAWLADHMVPLSICLALIGMQQFARVFLELRQRWPFGDRVALVIIAFFVILGVAATQLP